jgi:putative tryptophan/tyrosine transport system substrate-binding protein
MRRREFITLVGGAALLPCGVRAERSGVRTARVGVLSPFLSSGTPAPSYDSFGQTLRELGWVEGRNITFEYRWAEGRADQLPRLAAELAGLKVDVIYSAWGTPAALAAKAASNTIPVVFTGVGDAIGVGLVTSLVRPGGNVTGSTYLAEVTVEKELQLLREAIPKLELVGVFFNPSNPVYGPILTASEAAAKTLNLRLKEIGVQDVADIGQGFEAATQEGVGGVLVLRDPVIILNTTTVIELAEKYRMPALYGLRDFVVAGGLMSHGPNFRDLYRRAAYLVDKILSGAKPDDVPVEQSTKFETTVNLRAAKAIGIEIPTSILLRADEVIE